MTVEGWMTVESVTGVAVVERFVVMVASAVSDVRASRGPGCGDSGGPFPGLRSPAGSGDGRS